MKKTLANTKVFLYTPRRHKTRPRSVRVHRVVAQSGSAPAWGAGGRRFESCQPDQFPIREALQNTSSCKASNFLLCAVFHPVLRFRHAPCHASHSGCMTIFQNQTYTATKAGSLILPPFGNINRENYHNIHSLPLANKQKILGIFRVHAIHIRCHFLSVRPATPLPCRGTG